MNKKKLSEFSSDVEWFILYLTTGKAEEFVKNANPPHTLDIKTTINGIEVDFEEVAKAMMGRFDKEVGFRAERLLAEKMTSLTSESIEKLMEIEEAIGSLQKKIWEEVGFSAED